MSPPRPDRSCSAVGRGVAQHQRPDPLGVLVGEVQSENSSEGFSHIHRILYTQVVEDAAQIIDKDPREGWNWFSQ